MERQSEQVAKGTTEQARAARNVTISIESVSKDVGVITRSNRTHLESAGNLLTGLAEIRQVTAQEMPQARRSLSSSAGGA